MKIKSFEALRDASYMYLENRAQAAFRIPMWNRCSQLEIRHHMASYRSINPKSSPLQDQTGGTLNGCCRRGARNALALRVSAYGYYFSHLIQRILHDLLTP